jgi:uncharacterized cupin superfamily protein
MEGSDFGIMEGNAEEFPWGNEENHETLHIVSGSAEIRTGRLSTTTQNVSDNEDYCPLGCDVL